MEEQPDHKAIERRQHSELINGYHLPQSHLEAEFLSELEELVGRWMGQYMTENPGFNEGRFWGIFATAASGLELAIRSSTARKTTWERPAVHLKYSVPYDVSGRSLYTHVGFTQPPPFSNSEMRDLLRQAMTRWQDSDVLSVFSDNVVLCLSGGNAKVYDASGQVFMLTDRQGSQKKEELDRLTVLRTKRFAPIQGTVLDPKNGSSQEYRITLIVSCCQLTIDTDSRTAYHSMLVGIECEGFHLSKWSAEDRDGIWTTLYDSLRQNLPDEIGHEIASAPAFEVVPTDEIEKWVKVGLHAELLKFVTKKSAVLSDTFEASATGKPETSSAPRVWGLDLTPAESRALIAVQQLLDATNYEGNRPGKRVDLGEGRFKGVIPELRFTATEYLKMWGVKKYTTGRGRQEYSGEQRKQALGALLSLAKKERLYIYNRVGWDKIDKRSGKSTSALVEGKDPLIVIIKGQEAIEHSVAGKADAAATSLRELVIRPSPLLVDQVNDYYLLKPASQHDEIQRVVGRGSKYIYAFIDYLRVEVAKREIASRGKGNTNWTIEINQENLARTLRMDGYLQRRQLGKIRQTLLKCYAVAYKLGYLRTFATEPGKTIEKEVLQLNPYRFRWEGIVEEAMLLQRRYFGS
jgi:hypothetical protein